MASLEEEAVRKLAEMKAYLERRIRELEEELSRLRSFSGVIDVTLAEKSFRKVEAPKAAVQPSTEGRPPGQVVPINTVTGLHLADMIVSGQEFRIVPDPKIKFDINSPPLKAFLVARVLDPMQNKDREAASMGALSPDNVLSYTLEQENSAIKEIFVKNYGDEKRLFELKNAIRWTFRRMYEKITGPPK